MNRYYNPCMKFDASYYPEIFLESAVNISYLPFYPRVHCRRTAAPSVPCIDPIAPQDRRCVESKFARVDLG